MNVKNQIAIAIGTGLLLSSSSLAAITTVLSDSFSRSPAGTPVGTAPIKDTSAAAQAAATASWVSSWGANNNAAGGYVNQTYTTYVDASGNKFKVDGTNAISGNWLNNGQSLLNNAGASRVSEPIGITGFAWVQANYNFAADPVIQSAEKLRVSFDLYRANGGNIGWALGQSDATGVTNGNAGTPSTVADNDISLYFRGTQATTFGLRDNGALPAPVTGIASYDTVSYAAGSNITNYPSAIVIDITGTDFSSGATSLIELSVNGVVQDLNGSAVAGNAYTFTWDGGGAAYMNFASNNSPVGGTVAAPDPRAAGIDNLVIAAVPEPATLASLGLAATLLRRRRVASSQR